MKKINLLDEDIYKLFIKIALPASIGTIFNNLYSLVDTIFAGRMISETALAAIGQTFPVYFIIIALGIGLSIATTSNVANSLGEKNIKKASHAFSQSFVVTILVGLVITIFGLYFGNIILENINKMKVKKFINYIENSFDFKIEYPFNEIYYWLEQNTCEECIEYVVFTDSECGCFI